MDWVLGTLMAASTAALLVWLWKFPLLPNPYGASLRIWGGLGGLGLAMAGAVMQVMGWNALIGLALALWGSLLGVLAVWGADRLMLARVGVLRAAAVAALLGLVLVGNNLAAAVWIVLAALTVAQLFYLFSDPIAQGRLFWLRRNLEPWQALLGLAVLIRIPVPLWPEAFPSVAIAQIALITLAALLWGWQKIGWRIVWLGLAAFSIGLLVELLGSRTGFPFGFYTYSGAPAPTLFTVPLLVPLGWFSLVMSAHLLAGGRPWLTGLLVVAWDLGLEALMPYKGYWQWLDPNPLWYGAPIQNYLAWFAVGALISWLFARFAPELRRDSSFGWAYRLEALFIPVGLAMFGLYPAAVVCGLAMNLLAWRGVHWPVLYPQHRPQQAGD